MVLIRLARSVLLAGLLLGCEQSLFDAGDSDSNLPPPGAAVCPAECLGDAARDFAAAATPWRYLEDTRNRAWAPMAKEGKRLVGADPANAFTTCKDKSSAPACAELPGALLVSTAGGTAAADPAVELAITSKRVAKIGVRAFVPGDAPEQQVRIYRNSREDALFTGPATPGALFEQSVSADVLPGDRLLVALAPASGGATDIALEVHISDVGTPSSCQLALTFEEAVGNGLTNSCGAPFTSFRYEDSGPDTPIPATLVPSAFAEAGNAGRIAAGYYYKGSEIPDKSGDTTLQFWMRVRNVDTIYAGYVYSDHDLDNPAGGGIAALVYDMAGTATFESLVCTRSVPGPGGTTYAYSSAPYGALSEWKFLRIVYKNGEVSVCVNGRRSFGYSVPTKRIATGHPPYLGKNVDGVTPSGAFFDGEVDDLRMLSTALPCD